MLPVSLVKIENKYFDLQAADDGTSSGMLLFGADGYLDVETKEVAVVMGKLYLFVNGKKSDDNLYSFNDKCFQSGDYGYNHMYTAHVVMHQYEDGVRVFRIKIKATPADPIFRNDVALIVYRITLADLLSDKTITLDASGTDEHATKISYQWDYFQKNVMNPGFDSEEATGHEFTIGKSQLWSQDIINNNLAQTGQYNFLLTITNGETEYLKLVFYYR